MPDRINYKYLLKFKKLIVDYSKKERIIIVCGGGKTARDYIGPLQKLHLGNKLECYIGIRVTRLNAWLLINLFQGKSAPILAKSYKEVKYLLKRYNVIIIGGLGYQLDGTSDTSAVSLAKMLKSDFINITNVKGVYDKNPKFGDAKFIPKMTFNQLYNLLSKVRFKPGQHTILDFESAKILKKNNIKTYVIGPNLKNLKKLLNKKKFTGTIISG